MNLYRNRFYLLVQGEDFIHYNPLIVYPGEQVVTQL